ncbi:hypothetical protein ONZ45_g11993 [Pleurotus djamor]|nr:hypothetical protein ONZ45_g11993 [Pleurotus djamor]
MSNSVPPIHPVLPAELWFQILSYLCNAQLRSLRCLNRLFYNVALDAHYGSLVMPDYEGLSPLLKELEKPRVITPIPRVHDLFLYLYTSKPDTLLLDPTLLRKWQYKFSKLIDAKGLQPTYVPNNLEKLRVLMEGMVNLTRYHVQLGHHSHAARLAIETTFISSSLKMLAGRLEYLDVSIPANVLQDLSPVSTPFERLQRLSLIIEAPKPLTDDEATSLRKFLNHLGGTVHSFSLDIIPKGPNSTIQGFGSVKLPMLKRATLSAEFTHASGHEVVDFINAHGHILEELDFQPIISTFDEVLPLSSIRCPNLRRLRLRLNTLLPQHWAILWKGSFCFPKLMQLDIHKFCLPDGRQQTRDFCEEFVRSCNNEMS